MSIIQFENMNLSEEVRKAVCDMGFSDATQIQAEAIPLLLSGSDVIGRSHTGTGKTAAFGIPAIELITNDHLNQPQVLILCPTRELAMQACEEIKKFAKYKPQVKPVAIYGGQPIDRQIMALKRGANIVIGTPGRVMDHMRRRTLKFNHLKMVILDEADEMLNMGFREDIETILSDVPDERQTVLFSATMPPAILAITKQFQKDPQLVEIGDRNVKTLDTIEQTYYEVPMGRKMDVLSLLLQLYEPKLSIVFCNTKKMVDELADYLNKNGFKALGLHGDMKQASRTQVMEMFKSGRTPILIATDVAARGIDVDDVDAVFNFDIPQDTEYYIHRIGRTGRAGKTGRAFTLISGRKQFYAIKDIKSFTKADIVLKAIPSTNEIVSKKQDQFMVDIKAVLDSERTTESKEYVQKLLADGYDLEAIANGLMDMQCAKIRVNLPKVKGIPELKISKESKASFGDRTAANVKVKIDIGRSNRIAPNFIVGAMVEATGLPGKAIGKIEIFDEYTTVEVPSEYGELVIDAMKDCKINGRKTSTKLVGASDKQNNFKGSYNKGGATRNHFRDNDSHNRKRAYKPNASGAKKFAD